MKNLLSKSLFVLFLMFTFTSCGSDDDSTTATTNLSIDGQVLLVLPVNGLSLLSSTNIWGNGIDRHVFTVSGIDGTILGNVSFDLYLNHGQSIAGTYNILDAVNTDDADIEAYLSTHQRVCFGWTSLASIFDGTNLGINANNPDAQNTVTVTDNGGGSYTIQFNGNYRLYENGFDFVRNVPIIVNVTAVAYTG